MDFEVVEISSHQCTIYHWLEELEYWSSFTRNNCLRNDMVCAICIVPGLLKGSDTETETETADSRIGDPDWDPPFSRIRTCQSVGKIKSVLQRIVVASKNPATGHGSPRSELLRVVESVATGDVKSQLLIVITEFS